MERKEKFQSALILQVHLQQSKHELFGKADFKIREHQE